MKLRFLDLDEALQCFALLVHWCGCLSEVIRRYPSEVEMLKG
jgi:hypothetical protein